MAEASTSAEKSTASKSPASKGTAKKATAKKATAKASPRRAAAQEASTRSSSPSSTEGSSGGSSGGSGKASAMQVARAAAQQLAELTGRTPECVIGIERSDEGWQVELEVVESRRIPDSTDILATYRVQVDGDGELTGYHRVRRYVRGKGGEGDGGGR